MVTSMPSVVDCYAVSSILQCETTLVRSLKSIFMLKTWLCHKFLLGNYIITNNNSDSRAILQKIQTHAEKHAVLLTSRNRLMLNIDQRCDFDSHLSVLVVVTETVYLYAEQQPATTSPRAPNQSSSTCSSKQQWQNLSAKHFKADPCKSYYIYYLLQLHYASSFYLQIMQMSAVLYGVA